MMEISETFSGVRPAVQSPLLEKSTSVSQADQVRSTIISLGHASAKCIIQVIQGNKS